MLTASAGVLSGWLFLKNDGVIQLSLPPGLSKMAPP
jgi:hypothetical protein